MSNVLEPGKYVGTVEDFGVGTSSQKGTPFLNVRFKLKGTEKSGFWQQYLTANTMERVIENLVATGLLKTKKFSDLAEGKAGNGMCLETEVEVVIVHEEYEKDGEQKVAAKVAFVNELGGKMMKGMLAKAEAISVLEGLNLDAEILAAEAKTGVKVDDTPKDVTGSDVPF